MEIALNSYQNLLEKIKETLGASEQKIIKTINHEKVVMSWEIGRLIDEHLKGIDGSGYGEKLLQQIEEDTGIKLRTLYQMRSFFKAYPELPTAEKSLSWSHYRNLIAVKNPQARQELEDMAIDQGLGADKLQKEIIRQNAKKPSGPKPHLIKKGAVKKGEIVQLNVQRGELFKYKIKSLNQPQKANFIDCGFNIFFPVKNPLPGKDGDLIESVKIGDNFVFKTATIQSRKLNTYKAYLDRVVDGDTIRVIFDLGFGIQHLEIIRLAKINAPEAKTAAGEKSTKTLETLLKDVPFLVIKTLKTDIYGRYVGDIFIDETAQMDADEVAASGVYLNQKLLDLGVANAL